jgi:hypothetical protein
MGTGLSPSSGGANQAICHQAKKEVYNRAQVKPEWTMARDRRKRRQQEEIHEIAQNDRQQGLEQID